MGVFHFMGLGRSPGAVTVALSYLAARYKRWNADDQHFFATSGEIGQSAKPGDVQALVLFTTPEVRQGEEKALAYPYMDNKAGFSTGKETPARPMRDVLYDVLGKDLPALSGGRARVALYWCDYDRNRPTQTFERVARTFLAAKPPGKLGKEVWVNLTGGTNVLNSAFELASALTGVPARIYYVLVPSEELKLIRHTANTQWVELPIVNAALSQQHLMILLELPKPPGLLISELYSRLKGYGQAFEHVASPEQLNLQYLVQLRSQRLVEFSEREGRVSIGPRWEVLERYYEAIPEPVGTSQADPVTLDELAEREGWFHRDDDLSLE